MLSDIQVLLVLFLRQNWQDPGEGGPEQGVSRFWDEYTMYY
jgi:hypothetical protein